MGRGRRNGHLASVLSGRGGSQTQDCTLENQPYPLCIGSRTTKTQADTVRMTAVGVNRIQTHSSPSRSLRILYSLELHPRTRRCFPHQGCRAIEILSPISASSVCYTSNLRHLRAGGLPGQSIESFPWFTSFMLSICCTYGIPKCGLRRSEARTSVFRFSSVAEKGLVPRGLPFA